MDLKNKKILDVACGGRMFWFNKKHPNTLYLDNRQEDHILCDGRTFRVKPDMIMDFKDLKLPSSHFKLVVFDPPHFIWLGFTSYMRKKYGALDKKTWKEEIRKGFDECWRVLDKDGTLIFKWNQSQIPLEKLLAILPVEPLFGHQSGKGGNTIWLTFMKL